ncbi:MAG: ParB/RepB/Spo0J family partition protein [Bryobacterales bacterium]|nr:ParB/RepB/Spo0J family partition protein [Bryobacterales bacterium]
MNTNMNEINMRRLDVPLGNLARHVRNVRLTDADEEAAASLAASITAHGLLNPLVVEGSEERASVIAGGRRLAALQAIAATGALPPDHPVPCVLVSRAGADGDGDGGAASPIGAATAAEISLAENTGRAKMHPADEAEAFRVLRDAGSTDRQLAGRFGLSPRTVQRRLRLSRAAPELLARLRRGELALGVVEAATVEPDHGRQLRAVAETADEQFGRAHAVRSILTKDWVSAGEPLAQFVPRAAYEAAGGRIRTDVLRPGGGREMLDRTLLEPLALEALEPLAEAERALGWRDVRTGTVQPESWWEDRVRIAGARTPQDLEQMPGLTDGQREAAEVHLFPGRAWNGDEEDGPVVRMVLVPSRNREAPSATAADMPDKDGSGGRPKYSAALRRDLSRMRLSIERGRLADGPADLARDILLFGLVGQLYDGLDPAVWLACVADAEPDAEDAMKQEHVPKCVVDWDRFLALRERELLAPLRRDGVRSDKARWLALRAMDEGDKRRLLAVCVARMLGTRAAGVLPEADEALGELGINWDVVFDPGPAVLGRLPKAELMRIARERLDPEDIDLRGLNGMSKKDLVETVAAAFALHRERHSGRSPWIPAAIDGRDGG